MHTTSEGFKLTDSHSMSLYTTLSKEGVDVINRNIYLPDITVGAPLILKDMLTTLFALTNDDKSPINLYITTPGGDAYGMFGIVDLIKTSPAKVNTYALGMALSAGAWILAAGTGTRYAHKSSVIMLHDLQVENYQSNINQANEVMAHMNQLQSDALDLLAKFTKKNSQFWGALLNKKEHYMGPEEAKKLGLIDEVIEWPSVPTQKKMKKSK